MRGACDPGCAMDVHPEVVVAAEDPLACVQTHADAHGHPFGPRVLGELSLGFRRGPDRAANGREHGEERITLGSHLLSVSRSDGRSHNGVVAVKNVSVPLPESLQ
jgi:hypothetical protein